MSQHPMLVDINAKGTAQSQQVRLQLRRRHWKLKGENIQVEFQGNSLLWNDKLSDVNEVWQNVTDASLKTVGDVCCSTKGKLRHKQMCRWNEKVLQSE